MSPRRYDTTRRRAAAEATRLRILEAARAAIGGKGDLASFSMESVARKAGVARMTVYYQFHSRAELLEALADHLARAGGLARMPEVFAAPSLEEGVRALVDLFVRFWASDRVTLRRMRAMGVVFPADDRGPRERDSWRREAVENLLRRHRAHAGATGVSDRSEVVDLLTVLTSFETFDALAVRGRSPAAVSGLLSDAALQLLGIGPAGPPAAVARPRASAHGSGVRLTGSA